MRASIATLFFSLAFALVPAPGFPASRAVNQEWRFPAAPGKRIVVDTADMDVHLRAGDVEEILVTVDARISNVTERQAEQWIAMHTPTFHDSFESLDIETKRGPKGILGHLTAKARLSIVAPISAIPDIATLSGAIEVRGDFPGAAPLRLATMTGNISFLGAARSVAAVATSGKVVLRVVRPLDDVIVRTTSGKVTLSGGARHASVDTASGNISLTELSGSVQISTSSGAVTLSWDRLGAGERVVVRSTKGSVRLTLPPGILPGGELRTVTGKIRSWIPGTPAANGTVLKLAGQGPLFDIETAKAEIVIRVSGPQGASPTPTPPSPPVS